MPKYRNRPAGPRSEMFNSLRFRLIVSYIVIIAVCLAIMAVALALLVRSNPLSGS